MEGVEMQGVIGTIVGIDNSIVTVKLAINVSMQNNLVGFHVIFDDGQRKVVGEINYIDTSFMRAVIIGEIKWNQFFSGTNIKPSFRSVVKIIGLNELELILGQQSIQNGYTNLGTSNTYSGYKINVSINSLFDNHFAIIGNSGAGKSCVVASILQKLFISGPTPPLNSNMIFFDTYGEYTTVFSKLHEVNPNINYKIYTTNISDSNIELLRIPVYLLDVDDLALLLDATNSSQLQVIEKALKLVPILSNDDEKVIERKNDIIARAVQDILISGGSPTTVHDQVIAIFTKFNTPSLNLESLIVQPGYNRTLKQCLSINQTGKISELELVMNYIKTFIIEETEDEDYEELNYNYTLKDLEMALDFAIINEGILKSNQVFDYANILKVRLHSLSTGPNKAFFTYDNYVDSDTYINSLFTDANGNRCQITNININDIDERLSKIFTKIISRMILLKSTKEKNRGAHPYHIIIEEAHRYVQHDIDVDLLGYNIFERIIKEGRKFGTFLILVTQRPNELGNAVISQCSNFFILKTVNPADLNYIKEMIPSTSDNIMEQLKCLNPGNCIAFGKAFKIPISLYIDVPNPMPLSNNVNLEQIWFSNTQSNINQNNISQNSISQNSISQNSINQYN